MRLKFFNSFLLLFLFLRVEVFANAFIWEGNDPSLLTGVPSDPQLATEKPGVRPLASLRFGGKGAGESVRYLRVTSLALVESSDELTFACFVLPERRKVNEDMLASKRDHPDDINGFRLFRVWDRWGVELGNGVESRKIFASSKLIHNEWQHLAVTVKADRVIFYHDGEIAGEQEVMIGNITLPDHLMIGCGVNRSNPFVGWITGIYISDNSLDFAALHPLIRNLTE